MNARIGILIVVAACGGGGGAKSGADFVGTYRVTSHRANMMQGTTVACSDAGAEVTGGPADFALIVDPFFMDPSFIKKLTFTGTRIRDVVVNGDQGVWFSGEPHVLVYVDRNGSEFEDSERLAGNTLVWSHDGVTYRLECRCGPAKALAIASTMR